MRAVARYIDGDPMPEIATGAGAGAQTVSIWAREAGTPPRPKHEFDTSWHQTYITALEKGNLRTRVAPSWVEPFLKELEAGATIREASSRVSRSHSHYVRVYRMRRENPAFEARVQEAFLAARSGKRGDGIDPNAKRRLTSRLQSGATLKDAARAAGIPLATVKRHRRLDPKFDARVVAAAARGGRELSLYPRQACPGERCGTPTGYDYGCRKAPCTAAKSARVTAARRPG